MPGGLASYTQNLLETIEANSLTSLQIINLDCSDQSQFEDFLTAAMDLVDPLVGFKTLRIQKLRGLEELCRALATRLATLCHSIEVFEVVELENLAILPRQSFLEFVKQVISSMLMNEIT